MGLDPKRLRIVLSVMLATFLTAVDATIVETAIPRIVGALGGFKLFTWLVTGYLLTSTATIPLYGKLADIIGRKKTFVIGATLFLLGSVLCAFAQTMPQLILYRGLQGLGAGGIQPVVQTILGDIFTPTERAKVQGWFSSIWGLSGLIGPILGGVIVDYVDWRWLFLINLPLGLFALFMLITNLQEKVGERTKPVDYLGSALLTGGIAALMLGLVTGGTTFPWSSGQIIGLFVAAAVLLVGFVLQEQRHPDPMLPLDIFKEKTIGIANLASLVLGGVFYGTTVYLPLWAQGVQGYSATRSGASLLWLSIGWPIAAVVGGRYILKVGQRKAALLGLGFNVVGALGLLTLARVAHVIPPVGFALVTFLIGWGMGFTTLAFILGVQGSVGWERRGVATASLQFVRTLGGLVWVAVMGAAMNGTFAKGLQAVPSLGITSVSAAADFANELLDPAKWGALSPAVLAAARGALADALRWVHVIVLVCAVATFVVTLWFPNKKLDQVETGGGVSAH